MPTVGAGRSKIVDPAPNPMIINQAALDARYVNDDMNEVGPADIPDFSLTGPDISTTTGDIVFNDAAI
jgi:hypothetical protein